MMSVMVGSMIFEWDEVKSEANLKKHGIGFPLARRAFADRDRLEFPSDGDYEEERSVLIGLVDDRELVVVYTMREKVTRIISARRAERHEREAYWNRDDGTRFE
jgi:hypothetical protein